MGNFFSCVWCYASLLWIFSYGADCIFCQYLSSGETNNNNYLLFLVENISAALAVLESN